MAITRIDFQVFDVGQGSCNYARIWDDASPRVQNVLIDLGTEGKADTATERSVTVLAQQIATQSDNHIDVLVITHSDGDHYNMVVPLMNALTNPTIGTVYFGSVPKNEIFADVLAKLAAWCDNINGLWPGATSYDAASGTWTPLWSTGGLGNQVNLQLLVANATARKDVNTQSAVVGIQWNEAWMVAAGDATAQTFAAINRILAGIAPLNVQMLTMPHHGSFTTTYALSRPKPTTITSDTVFAHDVVQNFVATLRPQTISVSAFRNMAYKHPSLRAVLQFAQFTAPTPFWSDPALDPTGRHFVTLYLDQTITATGATPAWPPTNQYATTQTGTNIYPTFYFLNDPYNKVGTGPADPRGKRRNDAYPERWVCPPVGGSHVEGDEAQTGVPTGMNWTFTYQAGTLSVSNQPNPDRLDPITNRFRRVRAKKGPASVTTAAGRMARAVSVQPAVCDKVPA